MNYNRFRSSPDEHTFPHIPYLFTAFSEDLRGCFQEYLFKPFDDSSYHGEGKKDKHKK